MFQRQTIQGFNKPQPPQPLLPLVRSQGEGGNRQYYGNIGFLPQPEQVTKADHLGHVSRDRR